MSEFDKERKHLYNKIRTLTNACEALTKALIKSKSNEKELKEVIKEFVQVSFKDACEAAADRKPSKGD
jgi:uncharacterized protein YaaR (DUF327 family)